jgi:hypothetical protein
MQDLPTGYDLIWNGPGTIARAPPQGERVLYLQGFRRRPNCYEA